MFREGIFLVLTICGLAVHAIPQATPTLTTIALLGVNPPGRTPLSSQSQNSFVHVSITYDIVGVSSGSDGSETTFSRGLVYSADAPTTITSAGTTITTTTPFLVQTQNITIIESSGGMKVSISGSISGNPIVVGEYESCTFGSDGTGGCYIEVQDIEERLTGSSLTASLAGTITTSFSGGDITTVGLVTATLPLTLAASASSSNAAVGGRFVRGGPREGSRSVGWFMGVIVLPFAIVLATSL